ncbi:unnamed protein product, partial [Effrenium voratum]
VSYEEFIAAMKLYLGPAWDRKKVDFVHRVSAAFVVNFRSHDAASRVYRSLCLLKGVEGVLLRDVRPARLQGVPANLAFYLAWQEVRRPKREDKPKVFSPSGDGVSLAEARRCHVPLKLLQRVRASLSGNQGLLGDELSMQQLLEDSEPGDFEPGVGNREEWMFSMNGHSHIP